MKKYLVYFWTTLKVNTAYKAGYFLSLFMDAIFFFVSFAVWKVIYTEGNLNVIDTYSLKDTITYFFVTSILFRLEISGSIYLGYSIWSGFFTNDLIKPWRITLVTIIDAISDKTLISALYIPVLAIIFFSARSYIEIPTLINTSFFIISIILAFFLSVSFNLILHSLTFYFGDQDANIELFNYIALFLAGAFFPLAFLPSKLATLFNILPFRHTFFTPIEIFLGKMTLDRIINSWIETILWTVLFFIVYKILYYKGLKYYTGTGR